MRKINVAKIFLLVTIIFLFQLQDVCQAEDIGGLTDNGWKIVESKYCTILCHPDVNIKRVNNRIRARYYDIILDENSYSSIDRSIEQQLAKKFDRIFQKVEKILDMYPRKIHLTVKIYKNQSQLDEEYAQIFGQHNTNRMITYYVHKYSTIYTTERAIREGILAHEMGHAVIDHYFLILPPEKVKELLAQYVEIHLED